MNEQSQALRDVAAERQRQIEVEGWTPEHDDDHRHGELGDAAACYAARQELFSHVPGTGRQYIRVWPWERQWWKPMGRRRNLIKAGALIVAEIERLDRAPTETPDQAQSVEPQTDGLAERLSLARADGWREAVLCARQASRDFIPPAWNGEQLHKFAADTIVKAVEHGARLAGVRFTSNPGQDHG